MTVNPDPLTADELLAILAVLSIRLGKDHPLTRRVQDLHDHTQPEGDPFARGKAEGRVIGVALALDHQRQETRR